MKSWPKTPRPPKRGADAQTQVILRHWREAVPNDRLAHLVKDATRALLRALQMRLTIHGVALGHWAFLRILWDKDGITQRELSEQAGVMEPTTFSALKAMERLGYVMRRKLPGNRKKVFVYLTPRGRLLKAKLVPLAEQVNRVAVRNVKLTDIATTRQTLLAIIENLAEDEATASGRIPSTRELARRVAEGGKNSASGEPPKRTARLRRGSRSALPSKRGAV
jgi:DNA-binding MarR family transcriptional regulator